MKTLMILSLLLFPGIAQAGSLFFQPYPLRSDGFRSLSRNGPILRFKPCYQVGW